MSMSITALHDAYTVSNYMRQKLLDILRVLGDVEQSPDVEIQHPQSWSLDFAMDVDWALDVIARAFHNEGFVSWLLTPMHFLLISTVSTQWDVERYADHIGLKYSGMNDQLEETLRNMFKPLQVNHLEITPCMITDRHGRILLWYLPNILRPERQVRLYIQFMID
jgi:hypothetical protein